MNSCIFIFIAAHACIGMYKVEFLEGSDAFVDWWRFEEENGKNYNATVQSIIKRGPRLMYNNGIYCHLISLLLKRVVKVGDSLNWRDEDKVIAYLDMRRGNHLVRLYVEDARNTVAAFNHANNAVYKMPWLKGIDESHPTETGKVGVEEKQKELERHILLDHGMLILFLLFFANVMHVCCLNNSAWYFFINKFF